jgi:ketosteroid isomerase-like protein
MHHQRLFPIHCSQLILQVCYFHAAIFISQSLAYVYFYIVVFILILVRQIDQFMQNLILKGCTLTCILGLIIACNAKNENAVTEAFDKEQIKKEIQAKEDSFAYVYNSGDVKSIGYYADDAKSFYPNRPPLVGKASIIAFLTSDLTSPIDKIKYETKEVFVSNDGKLVVELGAFSVVDSVNTTLNTGNYMTLFEKRDGRYVAVRDMSTADGLTK